MAISIQQVRNCDTDQLNLCHQLLIDVFHHELNLFGMKIPDNYEQFSAYMQVIDSETIVGTYRIVLPNSSIGFPMEEVGCDLSQFDLNKVCEWSRLVLLKEARSKKVFSKIVDSVRRTANEYNASVIVAEILSHHLPMFLKYGFSQTGPAIYDPTIGPIDRKESFVIPIHMHI